MRLILPSSTFGIIGGGQLGKMLAEAANKMGYKVVVLDPSPNAPAFSACHSFVVSPFNSREGFEKLFSQCDVVTYEFENIDATLVQELNEHYCNIPQGSFPLHITQNRCREKEALVDAGLPVAPFVISHDIEKELERIIKVLGYPFVIKTLEGGYDGKGQAVIRHQGDLSKTRDLYAFSCIAEKFIAYDFECSIIGTRSTQGEFTTFPIAKNIHINNILHLTSTGDPQLIPIESKIKSLLQSFMERHNIVGTLAMEAFVQDNKIYINELAPRPHNSGHYTIEGCATSQFEQHVRAICGLPLGETKLIIPTMMYNILGQHKESLFRYLPNLSKDAHLHLYGKEEYKHNRKMGHITFTGDEGRQDFERELFQS